MPRAEVFNRDIVLNQMVIVFHNKGYNATSMQDLVDATQLNRSSIYNSFGNKRTIFLECLKYYQAQAKNDTTSILLKSSNSLQAIESIFSLYIDSIIGDNENNGCMISNCTSEMANQDVQITNFLNANQESMVMLLENLVKDGQKTGSINTQKDSYEYALFIFSSLQGFRTTGILLNDRKHLKSIVDIILKSLN